MSRKIITREVAMAAIENKFPKKEASQLNPKIQQPRMFFSQAREIPENEVSDNNEITQNKPPS